MNIALFATYFYNRKLYDSIVTAYNIQYKNVDSIEIYRQEKFKKLIYHARNNVPYYKDKLDDIELINDISKVGFLTKGKIKKNNNQLKAININPKRFLANSTSGSSGESLNFYSDNENFCHNAVNFRGDSWAGLKYGEKSLHFWGAERDIEKNKSLYKKIKHKYIVKNKMLSTYHMSEEDMKNYINIYNKYKPSVIVSYPTPLYHIADFIKKNNIEVFQPKGIIASSETLFPFQRELIEKIFGAKIFNRYGSREFGHIAAECKNHNGLHINTDRFILEIIDANGKVCKPGVLGEIVITDLDNYVFPFIRYKIGDLGILSDKKCLCGINLPLLEKVEGRVFDLIVGLNGNTVAGTFFTLLRNKINGWKKFQVIQEKIDQIDFILEDNDEIDKNIQIILSNIIKEKLGDKMEVNLKIVDKIPLTKTGKFRWVISKLSPYAK